MLTVKSGPPSPPPVDFLAPCSFFSNPMRVFQSFVRAFKEHSRSLWNSESTGPSILVRIPFLSPRFRSPRSLTSCVLFFPYPLFFSQSHALEETPPFLNDLEFPFTFLLSFFPPFHFLTCSLSPPSLTGFYFLPFLILPKSRLVLTLSLFSQLFSSPPVALGLLSGRQRLPLPFFPPPLSYPLSVFILPSTLRG